MNVTGRSLSSVANPIIQLTVFIFRAADGSSTPISTPTVTSRVFTASKNKLIYQCAIGKTLSSLVKRLPSVQYFIDCNIIILSWPFHIFRIKILITSLRYTPNSKLLRTIFIIQFYEKLRSNILLFVLQRCTVSPGQSTSMQCPMPSLNLPDDFLAILNSLYNDRRKRSINPNDPSTALTVNGPNGIDSADIYLGFILDGYEEYENINDALPDTKLIFYSAPEITSSDELIQFDSSEDELIYMKVGNAG